MKPYKEFQFGWLLFAILVSVEIYITYLYLNDLGTKPITTNLYLGISALFLLIYLLLYGMKTEIVNDQIAISFGVGVIKKKIKLNKIVNAEIVKNPWYYGWGIRLVPNGLMYNIGGFDAG